MITRITGVDSLAAELVAELDREMIPNSMPVDDTGDGKSCLLIQTAHSVYLFLGSTAADPRGQLAGGVFGEFPIGALLVGAISTSNSKSESRTALTAGSRAVFHIESDGVWRRVVTSPIVKLVHTHLESADSLRTIH
jgi:hypothetical protein